MRDLGRIKFSCDEFLVPQENCSDQRFEQIPSSLDRYYQWEKKKDVFCMGDNEPMETIREWLRA